MRFAKKSKFESVLDDIQQVFNGPYPLDWQVIEANVDPRSGVYIWCEELRGTKFGYVGQACELVSRLRHWARSLNDAQVYVKYAAPEELNELEGRWIRKAGDLNKK
jgi:hypothetical protein